MHTIIQIATAVPAQDWRAGEQRGHRWYHLGCYLAWLCLLPGSFSLLNGEKKGDFEKERVAKATDYKEKRKGMKKLNLSWK